MKVLCIGESILETICPIKEYKEEGSKNLLSEKYENGGGHAGNVAYLLGKWGVETYIASALGSDEAASTIKKEYESASVKLEYLETSYDKRTKTALVLVNNKNKTNTVFKINNNAELKKYAFAIEPDALVLDGTEFDASYKAINKYTNIPSILMVSTFDNKTIELCRYVNYIIINQKTLEDITELKLDFNNSNTLVTAYNKISQRFNKPNIIVTLGDKGCLYVSNGQIKIMPPIKIDCVDSYGAGDIFTGAFVYSLLKGYNMEVSVTLSNIAASLSVNKMPLRSSIPALTEVINYYNDKFGQKS